MPSCNDCGDCHSSDCSTGYYEKKYDAVNDYVRDLIRENSALRNELKELKEVKKVLSREIINRCEERIDKIITSEINKVLNV